MGRHDVGVSGGVIAEVGRDLPRDQAREVVDVRGKVVTPGLVDLHTHVHGGATYWGIDPDAVAWHSGVTTWVDAGSAGAYTFPALRDKTFACRVPILLNISAVGLTAPTGESRDLANCDVDLAIGTVLAHRERIAGIKVRMDRHTVGGNGLEPLRRAVEVAHACLVPLMVHIGASPPAIRDMLPLLRPGDIITHCASGVAAGKNRLDPAAKEAYLCGVLFDVGHGSGGFAFDVLEAHLEAGMIPHTVSSDLHARSLYGPVHDLPTTMAKMLAVGLSLEQVVAAATARPAQALKLAHGAGTLVIGAPADIAVFSVEEGVFDLVDAQGQRRRSSTRLRNEATYVAGNLLPAKAPEPPPPWIALTAAQEAALQEREQRFKTS